MDNNIINKMKENYFKGKELFVTKIGGLTILDWKETNSDNSYIKYIIDKNKLFISTNDEEAIFKSDSNSIDIHSFDNMNIFNFLDNICSFKINSFSGLEAARRLEEWKQEILKKNKFKNDNEIKNFINNMDYFIDAAKACFTEEEWCMDLIEDEFNWFITGITNDYEWLCQIGTIIPDIVYVYLAGLQLISERLNNNICKDNKGEV